jgi:predicted transcriptional regulator
MSAPRKYPPKDAAAITEKMASEGYSQVGIAKHFGVSRETFKRWCDEYESIQEAFDVGRETERVKLHSLIVQAAIANKGANVNAMFLLKTKHGYRETDSPSTKVNVPQTQINERAGLSPDQRALGLRGKPYRCAFCL